MWSFEPDDEQKMLIDWTRRFATNDLRPAAREAEEGGDFPQEIIQRGWELGVLQASIPGTYGGFGDRSAITGVLAAEELAWGDLAGALAIMTPGLFALPILLAGSEEQKQTYLSPVVEGEWMPFTAALIEPSFDFDPNELDAIATEDPDGYILQGVKALVPFGDVAKGILVYARLGDVTQGFILLQGTEGLQVAERQRLLGINAVPLYRLVLDNVRVPKENRLGGPEGHPYSPILDASRVAMAAMGVGVARAAFEYSRDYAKDREVFGVKVAQKQAIAFMLAEMVTEIEAIRLLNWEAAWMLDRGDPEASKHAYLALAGAMDMAMMVTDRAVQILGGHGYIREHPVELWMRNGRGISTFTGLAMV